jgi:hypothetical protein
MESNTNNLAERVFGNVKYIDLSRNARSSVIQLMDVLLIKTNSRHMQQRALQLVGRASSDQVQQGLRIQRIVDHLVNSGAVAKEEGSSCGRASVTSDSGSAMVVLGDMTCTCSYSGEAGCEGPVLSLAAAKRSSY